MSVEGLPIKHDIRLDQRSTGLTAGNFIIEYYRSNLFIRIMGIAIGAVMVSGTAVNLILLLAACLLVQHVYVLGIEGTQVPFGFQFGKGTMHNVWLVGIQAIPELLCPSIEYIRVLHKEGYAQDMFHIETFPLLGIDSFGTTEIRDPRKRGDPCPGEDCHPLGIEDQGLKNGEFLFKLV